MKRILISLAVAMIMFGASATASWKWQQKRAAESAAAVDEHAPDESAETNADSSTAAVAEEPPAPPTGRKRLPDASNARQGLFEQGDWRGPGQPAYTGLEDSVQAAASLRERMAAIRERESQLGQRQAQMELILKDIRAQRAAIEELRVQVNDELKATEEQLVTAERKRAEIDAQQQSLEERVTELSGVEREGTKRLASVYDGMAADRAAKILEHMVNSGNMDTAVKLLGVMRERQAAKVLGEFEDTSLAAQLSERLKGLKKPALPQKG